MLPQAVFIMAVEEKVKKSCKLQVSSCNADEAVPTEWRLARDIDVKVEENVGSFFRRSYTKRNLCLEQRVGLGSADKIIAV